jgi:hypothetical protein
MKLMIYFYPPGANGKLSWNSHTQPEEDRMTDTTAGGHTVVPPTAYEPAPNGDGDLHQKAGCRPVQVERGPLNPGDKSYMAAMAARTI